MIDLLIDFNADGTLGDVPDLTGAAMVELVGHTLMDGAVNPDVDIIADVVGPQVGREMDSTLLSEGPREGIPRSRPQTMSGRHFY